jgi:putative oxidoreductase
VPLSGIIALIGGLCVLFGFQTRLGAGLLVIFLVPVTLVMHNFWSAPDPKTHQIETAMFITNVTMLGSAFAFPHRGRPTSSAQHLGNRFACGPVYMSDVS